MGASPAPAAAEAARRRPPRGGRRRRALLAGALAVGLGAAGACCFAAPARARALGPPSRGAAGGADAEVYEGVVKSFSSENGFGFISCEDARREFGRDVFLHRRQAADGVQRGDVVRFTVQLNEKREPQARDVELLPGGDVEEDWGEEPEARGVEPLPSGDSEEDWGEEPEAGPRLGLEPRGGAAGAMRGGDDVDDASALKDGPQRAEPTFDVDAVTSFVQGELAGSGRAMESIVEARQAAQPRAEEEEGEAESDPLVLQLRGAQQAEEVVDIFLRLPWGQIQARHVAWACRRLVALQKDTDEQGWARPEFEEFAKRARATLEKHRPGPWETGSLLGAVSILEPSFQPIGDLLPQLIRTLPGVMEEMSANSLVRSLSSIRTLQARFPGVKTVAPSLVEEIVAKIDSFDNSGAVRVISFAGSLELSGPEVQSLLEAVVPRLRGEVLRGMSTREIAYLARGLAQLGEQPTELFGEIADVLSERRENPMWKKQDFTIHLPMILGAFARAAVYSEVLLETVATVWMRKGMMRRMKGWTLCMMTWAWPWHSDQEMGRVVSTFHSLLQKKFRQSSATDEMVEFAWRGPDAFEEAYPRKPRPGMRPQPRRGADTGASWEDAGPAPGARPRGGRQPAPQEVSFRR